MAIEKTTFQVRINGGPEQQVEVATGVYAWAVAALPALLGTEVPADVEIWVKDFPPEYGPYFLRLEHDQFVRPTVTNLVRADRKSKN